MANLIIKPTSGGSLILQDEGGTAANTISATGNTTLAGTANNLGTVTVGTLSSAVTFPNGHIIQVVQTVKTDTFTSTTDAWVDVTGMSVAITPSDASNKVLVVLHATCAAQTDQRFGVVLLRGSTEICFGDASSSRNQGTFGGDTDASEGQSVGMMFLDSPATTSATTYKIQAWSEGSTPFYLNRTHNDGDNATYWRAASTITVMEVVA